MLLNRLGLSFAIASFLVLTACQTISLPIYQGANWQFSYPPAWIAVENPGLATIAFRDPLSPDRNLSLLISPVPDTSQLSDLGDPTTVGYELQTQWLNRPDRGRQVELLAAEQQETALGPEYLLEYAVQLEQQSRHDLAAIALARGQLYTFVISLPAAEFERQPQHYRQILRSFQVLSLSTNSSGEG
ncbi:photosystem II reaction center PsbP [Synechococcus elongatus]|nr:photosystem II reaction center PsbP [Synechococcus elongatus]WKW06617.1 photosystem II reaction center PsbP [Synechococcus elongatus PCC 7942 = FACHB-805]